MLAYPDAQMIDVMGPLEVFASATKRMAGVAGAAEAPPAYSVEIVAGEAGPVRMSSGLELVASRALRGVRGEIDTLVIAGGEGSRVVLHDRTLIRWLQRTAPQARRVASVCTGALLLAEAGLLEGRRATRPIGRSARHLPIAIRASGSSRIRSSCATAPSIRRPV